MAGIYIAVFELSVDATVSLLCKANRLSLSPQVTVTIVFPTIPKFVKTKVGLCIYRMCRLLILICATQIALYNVMCSKPPLMVQGY